MTTSLIFAIGFAVVFVVLAVVTVVLQSRKMSNIPNDLFSSFNTDNPQDMVKGFGKTFFKGFLPIVLCGMFAGFSAIAALVSVVCHFCM
jgi:hypothetical protein